MATTDDYKSTAAIYKNLFDDQGRVGETAIVSSSEQFNRDNLLHFIEDNFKSNVKGGVTLENLRAFLHTLVKSTRNYPDDTSNVILVSRFGKCFTGATNRYYYGDNNYGGEMWSSYVTDVEAIPAERAYNGIVAPFDLRNAGMAGVINNRNASGDVEVSLYYTDEDTGVTSLANATLVGSITIDATAYHSHNFEITSSVTIPKGKVVWALLKNDGYDGSGSDIVYFQHSIFGSTH